MLLRETVAMATTYSIKITTLAQRRPSPQHHRHRHLRRNAQRREEVGTYGERGARWFPRTAHQDGARRGYSPRGPREGPRHMPRDLNQPANLCPARFFNAGLPVRPVVCRSRSSVVRCRNGEVGDVGGGSRSAVASSSSQYICRWRAPMDQINNTALKN